MCAWCENGTKSSGIHAMPVRRFITFGTLLGAVRGGKFIPDDTDADIMVDERHWDELVRALIQLCQHTRYFVRLLMIQGSHAKKCIIVGDP